jgi:hypothetical protein
MALFGPFRPIRRKMLAGVTKADRAGAREIPNPSRRETPDVIEAARVSRANRIALTHLKTSAGDAAAKNNSYV